MPGGTDDHAIDGRASSDGRPVLSSEPNPPSEAPATPAAAPDEPLPQWTVTVRPDRSRSTEAAQPDPGQAQPNQQATTPPSAGRAAVPPPVPALSRQPYAPPPEEEPKRRRGALGLVLLGLGALALVALGALGYATLIRDDGSDDTNLASETSSDGGDDPVQDIQLLLQGVGYDGIDVEQRDGTVFLSGTVESQADIAAVVTATASQAEGLPINTDALTVAATPSTEPTGPTTSEAPDPVGQSDPLQRLQIALNRTMAATPIIFEPGTSSIASWHGNTLDQVADLLLANPGIAVAVVGYTDDSGSARENQAISEERASSVRDYLVDRGLDPGIIKVEARGESEATGIRDIGYLERRVEFEVVAVSLTPPVPLPLDVGIIVPSASDDLAFSQSLVDALAVLDGERGGLTLNITENMFDVDQAAEHLAVTPRFVRTLVAERRVPFLKVGKFVRFDADDLDAWLDACRVDVA